MGLGHNGTDAQRDWDEIGLGRGGTVHSGLGHNGSGIQRKLLHKGKGHNVLTVSLHTFYYIFIHVTHSFIQNQVGECGDGTQWDWDTTGVGRKGTRHNGTRTRREWDAKELVNRVPGTQ